jgi:tetratricopeptide (TPR) repeat protein
MASLAEVYVEQGYYDKAEKLYEDALAASKITFGEENPNTLWCTNNLAILYRNQGRFNRAEDLYISCLDTCRVKLGEEHPSTLTM